MPKQQPQTARRSASASLPDGVFTASAAYSFDALRARGFGSAALREMQKQGLKARLVGRQKIVLGSDLLAFFEQLPVEQLRDSRRGEVRA